MNKLQKLTHIPKSGIEAEIAMEEELQILLKHMETSCEDEEKIK